MTKTALELVKTAHWQIAKALCKVMRQTMTRLVQKQTHQPDSHCNIETTGAARAAPV